MTRSRDTRTRRARRPAAPGRASGKPAQAPRASARAPRKAARTPRAPAQAPRASRGPAAAHPPGTVTQAEYARKRGVSREAVRKAVRDGRIQLEESGRIAVAAADAAWRANTDPSRRGASGAPAPGNTAATPAPEVLAAAGGSHVGATTLPEGMTYADARALKEWNQARMLDLQRRKLESELVEVQQVEDMAFRAARTTRDLLLGLPDRLDTVLAAVTDSAEVRRIIDGEVRRVFQEFEAALKLEADEPESLAS